jgi:hypothetical protein
MVSPTTAIKSNPGAACWDVAQTLIIVDQYQSIVVKGTGLEVLMPRIRLDEVGFPRRAHLGFALFFLAQSEAGHAVP